MLRSEYAAIVNDSELGRCDCPIPNPVVSPNGTTVCNTCGVEISGVELQPTLTNPFATNPTARSDELAILQNTHFVRHWGGSATTFHPESQLPRIDYWARLAKMNEYGQAMPRRIRLLTKIIYNLREMFSIPFSVFCEAVQMGFVLGKMCPSKMVNSNASIAVAAVVGAMRKAHLPMPLREVLEFAGISRQDYSWGLRQLQTINQLGRVDEHGLLCIAIAQVSAKSYMRACEVLKILTDEGLLTNKTTRSVCATSLLIACVGERKAGITRIAKMFDVTTTSVRESYLQVLTECKSPTSLQFMFPQVEAFGKYIMAFQPLELVNWDALIVFSARIIALLFPNELELEELVACALGTKAIACGVPGARLYRYMVDVLGLPRNTIYLSKVFAVFMSFYSRHHSRSLLNAAVRRVRNVFSSRFLEYSPKELCAAAIVDTNQGFKRPIDEEGIKKIVVIGLGVGIDRARLLGSTLFGIRRVVPTKKSPAM